MEVLGLATNGADAVAAADEYEPELILMDLGLPDISGIEAARKILQKRPNTTVLAVTAMTDPDLVGEAIRSGFVGYVTKDTPLPQFVLAIESALNGQVVMPRKFAQRAAGATTAEEESAELLVRQLTRREREVLTLLTTGANSAEIARKLTVSSNTVRSHIQNILTKLQVHSRLEAAAFAVRHGVVRNGH
jgi:DNA-binding NarL/FixJ family response regulator